MCQTAAVLGGKSLATQISERFVCQFMDLCDHCRVQLFVRLNKLLEYFVQIAFSGGILFIVFGIQSFFSTIES